MEIKTNYSVGDIVKYAGAKHRVKMIDINVRKRQIEHNDDFAVASVEYYITPVTDGRNSVVARVREELCSDWNDEEVVLQTYDRVVSFPTSSRVGRIEAPLPMTVA